MTTIIQAIYEQGVFKPKNTVPLEEHQKVCMVVTPIDKWQKEFAHLFKKVHARTQRFLPKEIEEDISSAFSEVQKKS